MRPLLVLRPEPGASRTVARAQALGLSARATPLFAIQPVDWTPPDPADFDALLLTSANAVRQAGAGLTRYLALPVHAVGAATAEAARAAGFDDVCPGPGDVAALLGALRPPLRLLHLCGTDRRDAAAGGIAIDHVPVYRSTHIDNPAGLAEALAGYPVILVHSPRAALRLKEIVADRAGLALAAISAAAATAAGEGWDRIGIAAEPHDEALLAVAARLCENRHDLMRNELQA